MKLTEQQVRHVAKLARLALTREELDTFGQQLSHVLDAVDALAQVDTSALGGPAGSDGATPHLREDVVSGETGTKVALANAPLAVGSSFAIPRVLE